MNNFDKIATLINKPLNEDEFFFVQIYKRRKDNPDMDRDMVVIDNFFIKSWEDLLRNQYIIVDICEINNARAYIRLNRRSKRKVALQTLKLIAENIASDNYEIKNCYLSSCGKFHSEKEKTWIVDIDYDSTFDYTLIEELDYEINEVITFVQELIRETDKDDTIHEIVTKNGLHLITPPFNLQKFREKYPKIDVHKDNPTLLYCP